MKKRFLKAKLSRQLITFGKEDTSEKQRLGKADLGLMEVFNISGSSQKSLDI